MTLLIIAWLIDGAILLYLLQLLVRMGVAWQGARSIVTLMVLDVAAIAVSSALVAMSQTRWIRQLALGIASAMPLAGALGFLSVGLIAAASIMLGGRWN